MSSPAFWRNRGVKYLERYAYLLLFAAHVFTSKAEAGTFTDFMRTNWAFKRTIRALELE